MDSSRVAGVLLACLAIAASAAEPTLTHLYPVAGAQGTTAAISVSGKADPWPPQVWVDAPGIVFQPSKTKGKFDVQIAPDAKPGPHLIRLFNAQGVSAPRFFIVSDRPELLEVEPNNDFKSPQKVTDLPATISGRLDKAGDVDSYAVTLQKGQALTAEVEAYVLASTFDGMLRIVDPEGTQLAFNHDGKTLDPLLNWVAPRDGTFVVQIMGFVYPATAGVGLTGGEGCVYRLHLTTGAATRVKLPPHDAVQGTETIEKEPNGTFAEAQPVAVPGTIPGQIEKPGDEDRFGFTAVKKQAYEFKLVAAEEGSALDGWLKVENKDGKELVRNDDAAGSKDPQLTWTAPSDGVFVVVVGDVTHRGGEAYPYRLVIAEAKPAVVATAASHSVNVTAGKEAEIKATVKRSNGYKTALQLTAKGLPDGITAPPVAVPDKDGEVTLKIVAGGSAAVANQPFQLILREVESGAEYPVSYSLSTTGENNGVPQAYTSLVIDATDQLWLTVIAVPPKPEPAKAEAPPAEPKP